MYAVILYDTGRVSLVETPRFFCAQYLSKDVVSVDYYHETLAKAKKQAHKLAKANARVIKVAAPLKSGDRIKNSWSIMEEQGYILG